LKLASATSRLELRKEKQWGDDWDEGSLSDSQLQSQPDEKAILREKASEALLFEIKEALQKFDSESSDNNTVIEACTQLVSLFYFIFCYLFYMIHSLFSLFLSLSLSLSLFFISFF